jgi:hypothetical protein
MFIVYWAFVDEDAHKAFGSKWIWLQGTYHPNPDVYNDAFNHLVLPPWEGWDTWQISSNNPAVGELGGEGTRVAHLSEIPALQEAMGGEDVNAWFQGRWHHFQLYMKLNTPASEANGILQFSIDGALVLDVDDYRYRDNDEDHIDHFATPHMYGGAEPPPGTFGWQLDELAVWDGMPTADGGGGGGGGSSGDGAGPPSSSGSTAGGGAEAGNGQGGNPAGASADDEADGCACRQQPSERAPALPWLILVAGVALLRRRGA